MRRPWVFLCVCLVMVAVVWCVGCGRPGLVGRWKNESGSIEIVFSEDGHFAVTDNKGGYNSSGTYSLLDENTLNFEGGGNSSVRVQWQGSDKLKFTKTTDTHLDLAGSEEVFTRQ